MEQEEFGCEIESEVKFLNLFGYQVIGPDTSNRYIVVDEKGVDIGFIQKKKMNDVDTKRNLPIRFGYYTQVKSDKVEYQNVRKEADSEDNTYEFSLGHNDQVCICLGQTPKITICSKKHGTIDFSMNQKAMMINHNCVVGKFRMEQTVYMEASAHKKVYEECISLCNRNKQMASAKDRTTVNTTFRYDSNYDKEHVIVHKLEWKNRKIVRDETVRVSDTFDEIIQKNPFSFDTLYYFQSIVDRLLPLQNGIFMTVFGKTISEKYAVFMPKWDEQSVTQYCKK